MPRRERRSRLVEENAMQLILASQSPRRRELLAEAGFSFEIIPPDVIEPPPEPGESPIDYVKRLAVLKAENVAAKLDDGTVIACDTVVVCQGEILGKPVDRSDAERMLRLLRGELHYVHSGVCVWTKSDSGRKYSVAVDTTTLQMLPISDTELDVYLDSGAWRGKAGAFGLQDRTGWITLVHGSETNVVGLPMELLRRMLETPD